MSSEAGQALAACVAEAKGDLDGVRSFLDGLAPDARVDAVRALRAGEQRKLWRLAEGFMALSLTDLVAADQPPLSPVRHYGKNSMPMFSLFEKRFYRLAGDAGELGGANFQALSPLTGPGYYVATEDVDRGEVLVDYHRVPPEHPPGWPDIVANERGRSRLVYGFMVDTLRRVSEHVTVGRAARRGKDMNAWFLLCREA